MAKVWIGEVLRGGSILVFCLAVFGCARGPASQTEETPSHTLAQTSDIAIAGSQPGVTPFISSVQFTGNSISRLASVTFTISPMPNSVSAPVEVTWSTGALAFRNDLEIDSMNLPVFGLYQNYQNQLSFQLEFADGSEQDMQYEITTEPYTDPTGVYMNPTVVKARAAGSNLGFNFFILKSTIGSPIIVDTDGQVRWAVPIPSADDTLNIYYGNGLFVLGSNSPPVVTLLGLDGTQSASPTDLPQPLYSSFSHNIDPGRTGLLAEFNGTDDLGPSDDDIVAEFLPGSIQPPIQTFDMADILTSYMKSQGDDPTAFVHPGADWFHANAATYDPSDNTVIISSREDFLIKLNYSTHVIVWILGDPTKYWYSFPSLRAKALTLNAGGDYPIGQHGVSITSNGNVMVFNDGYGSLNQPPGEPAGLSRTFSEVSAYSINEANKTAQNVWNFNYGQSIYAPICGSVYESGNSYLVDFATADNFANARLVGLDTNRNVVFDFQYVSPGVCAAAWNAIPIPLENLQIN
ncbi:MAG: aryl-sulfate sulfotransferase [Terracidiphilus sp.]